MAEIEVTVAEDGLEARIRLPSETEADPERRRRLAAALARAGVSYGLDRDRLARIEAALGDPSFFADEVIARGLEPRPGRPGRLITAFCPFSERGEIDQYDRIDFREQHRLIVARQGEILARRYPAAAGAPGRDVRDAAIDPAPVAEDPTRFGPGVEIDDAGFVRALRSGVIHHRPAEALDVLELYEHRGDVGPKSGNLGTGGSLLVQGDVLPGFRVEADGDIVVTGTIDQASFRAGGSVEVRQAVIGGPGTRGRAGVDLTCRRIQGATLKVHGRLTFDREVFNASIRTLRLECSSPKGTLVGTSVVAIENVRVANVGSESGAPLVIEVGNDWRLEDRIRRLEAAGVSRGRRRRAGGESRARDTRGSRRLADELNQLRLELRRRNKNLVELAAIEVTGTIRAGVTLKFGTVEETLAEDENHVRFRFDPETGLIAREKLKR